MTDHPGVSYNLNQMPDDVDKQDPSNEPPQTGGVTGKGFQPGKSGNPAGRPRRAETFGSRIREFLDAKDPKDKEQRARMDVLIEEMYRGKPEDRKTLLAYGFGKPVEMVELRGAEGGPEIGRAHV